MRQLFMFALSAIIAWGYYMWRSSNTLFNIDRSVLPVYTLEELKNYNSTNDVRLLVINGLVFDVTSSDKYCEGGGYSKLAGHDVSVSLSRMDLGDESVNTSMAEVELTEQQMKSVKSWEKYFIKKGYGIVGRLAQEGKAA
mmetsp:Transcript_33800/g.58921  ORF Transcript_33800/g.58921 Transcript_33800/m.58921 type:complete len:140 (+) Transcript_33800:93-512(+)|eukprot:CAMPEP_0204918462 /NCGR_PEP_ID=MMETSP1397-20131031/16170_1 /ASSEMBLY_ACC=CAM_ASM_000891 /TAXON_ID=49980 /ORGANISM="Climacostomum Climacostomum virens, Strain Stock W-24" /LENGTH=139 /DNA_ID=CAMNT_0052091761 /DNA_START=32 /DNA_END=451 /DNA_ORIENTATION=-